MLVLKETFLQLLKQFSTNDSISFTLWNEIEKQYSSEKRHYHNLTHLENLLMQLTSVKAQIRNWEAMLFTLFYHDLIYNPLRTDNEEKSAELAELRMKSLSIAPDTIQRCKAHILATKSHQLSADSDTNYFLDADLSVLGQAWEHYEKYYKNVRKEYALYPDLIYNPGRKKVLAHFLHMERIFKTDFFHQKFEQQAKENLKKEITMFS